MFIYVRPPTKIGTNAAADCAGVGAGPCSGRPIGYSEFTRHEI